MAIVAADAAQTPRLTSLSGMLTVPSEGASLSFTLAGSTSRTMLIRAVGPTLATFGVSGLLADPRLVLTNASGTTVASNDDWGGEAAIASASRRLGAFELSSTSRDAAVLVTLAPGAYTATTAGAGNSAGVVVLEMYAVDTASAADLSLSFVSLRGRFDPRSGRFTVHLAVSGATIPTVVRALGPALGARGIAGAIYDPTVSVLSRSGTPIASNDNWAGEPSLNPSGAPSLAAGSRDSALATTFPSDHCTVAVGSANGAPGIVELEIHFMRNLPIAPVFTSHPRDMAVEIGSGITLTTAASGIPAPTFQWQKDGADIASATGATYSISSAQARDSGVYTCVAYNSAGKATSRAGVLRVEPPSPPSILAQPHAITVSAGDRLRLTVTAAGIPSPSYQWRRNGIALPNGRSAEYTVETAQAVDAGLYTVVVSNRFGTVTSEAATVAILLPCRLSNLSVRTTMNDGQKLVVGMVMSGGPRRVLVRAAGPALEQLGLFPAVANPRITLLNVHGVAVHENDDWTAELAASFSRVGAFPFPFDSRDAALDHPLDGQVSAEVAATGSGTLLVEAYDLGSDNAARFVNLSVLNRVGAGDSVLIAGFSLSGTGSKRILIRAVGPSLARFNINDALQDPVLEVVNSSNLRISFNNDWDQTLEPIMRSVGAFPLQPGSSDAAVLVTLSEGTYSAVMTGVDGTVGSGIIELYELP